MLIDALMIRMREHPELAPPDVRRLQTLLGALQEPASPTSWEPADSEARDRSVRAAVAGTPQVFPELNADFPDSPMYGC